MLSGADEGPVYYREIQKNAFLKRIPDDAPTGKLRPLGHKKSPLKPMWTLFCVHNGRTPFLEQYPEPDCPAALAHRPAWRACLRSARHVTASVKPHAGDEYDFLVDTDHGPVRMLAPDWDSMQDWVSILRAKLHELRILSRGENVYGAPPVAPAPRAAARDPTSPLPPTPPVPPDRVPGIDLTSIARPAIETTQSTEISPTTATATATIATASATTSTNAHETTSTPTAANSTSTKTTGSSTTNLNVTTTTNLPTFTDTTTSSSFTNAITNLNIAATCVSLTPINTSNVTTFTNATANVTTFTNATANVTTFTNATANVTTFTNATANVTTFTNATANVTTFTNATANVTTFTNAAANVTTFTNATANVTTFTNATASLTNEQDNEVDISNWEPFSLPSTSRDSEPKQSVAKICGQNICLDDSILKRNVTDSDEDFFAEIDKMHDSTENVEDFEFTQRLVVTNGNDCTENQHGTPLRTNVTVIQVSNKAPPHTAIPVLGPETDVFDFEFKQKLQIDSDTPKNDFINIVHTENDRYGSVFEKTTEEDYGHISLTTTVSLTGDVKVTDDRKDGVYERLCMASTSIMPSSPLQVRSLKDNEKIRKSSLPNLEIESDYEYLFPNSSQNLPNGRNTNRDASSNVNGITDVLNREIRPNSRIAHSNLQNSREVTNRNIQTNSSSNRENVPNVRNMPSSRENLPDRTQINVTNREVVPNGRNEGISTNNEVSRVNLSNISVRSNIERSASQNAYDIGPRQRQNEVRRVQNNCPKRDNKIEKSDSPPKPIWKRGLTELSLLSRLRGLAQPRRPESPTRQHDDRDRGVTSPVKVVHRSRAAGRADGTRRRSSSLTNSHSPGAPASPALQPLRARQAAALRAEQRRGACAATAVPVRDPPLLCDYDRQVWVARWGMGGSRSGGRAGDRVSGAAGSQPSSAAHARLLLKAAHTPVVDILFHRVPLAKIYVIHKKDQESLGIKLDSECTIVSVDGQSPAGRAGLPPPGKWAVTEVNNRPVNLVKGGEEEMNRIAANGTEVSVLIQPAALVKKIRAAIKASKPLLAIR